MFSALGILMFTMFRHLMKFENCKLRNKVANRKFSWFFHSLIAVINNNQLSLNNLSNDRSMSNKSFIHWKSSSNAPLIYWQMFQSSFRLQTANVMKTKLIFFHHRLERISRVSPASISIQSKRLIWNYSLHVIIAQQSSDQISQQSSSGGQRTERHSKSSCSKN